MFRASDLPTTHLPGTNIAVALESGRRSGWWRFGRALVVVGVVVGLAAGLGMAALAIVQVRAGWFSVGTGLSIVVFAMLGWQFVAWVRARGLRFPRWPDPSARVRVVGPESMLRTLLTGPSLPPASEAFEPVVLRIGPPWYIHPLAMLVMIALLVVLMNSARTLLPGPGWLPVVVVFVTWSAVFWTLKHAFPRYARLVPGRLDILRGSLLGSRLTLRRSYDLRTPAVLVDFNTRVLLLIAADGSTQSVPLPTAEVWPTLVPAILRAAISTAPAAPLPDDALVG
jgi:hypothetical protein